MKKIVWMLIGIIILANCSYAKTFSDVGKEHWANNIINEWTNNGIISGYNDGTFKPNGTVIRAELVTILNKINNDNQIISKRPSKDIKITDWYCSDMAVALKNGLIELDKDGNLNPKSLVTREEAIVMIAKLFNLKYSGDSLKALSKFSDYKNIKNENLPYVAGMAAEGYISGTNGKLNPKKEITRAELVAMLDRVIEKIHTTGQINNSSMKGNLVLNGKNIALSNLQVDGYIFLLKGAKHGIIDFYNVYATKGIKSEFDNVISYNDGTKPHDNLSNIEEERSNAQVQFVKIDYSEIDWTNKSVTATLKFDNKDMEIINNNGKNKYKFTQNGEFTFICVDGNGNEYRYTAKVDNIAKKELEMAIDVKDNSSNAVVTISVLANEAPINSMYYIEGKESAKETINYGEEILNNQFIITETGDYTVAIGDEAGNTAKQEFYWKNTSKYAIDVIQNVGGKITPENSGDIPYRGSQSFNIVANTEEGYDLIGLKVDGKEVEDIVIINNAETSYSFTDITEDHSIEAIFKLREYPVEVIQPANGRIVQETALIEHGSSMRFEMNPDVGYEISKVLVDGIEVEFDKDGDGATYELTNVTEEHEITAEFTKKKYTILVQKPDTGKISYDDLGNDVVGADEPTKNTAEITVEHGDSITLYIFPNTGYEVIDVVIDNLSVGARNVYTFREIDQSHSFVAMFENGDSLQTFKIGPYAYAAIYPDYSCVIYGFGDVYDFELDAQPLGEHTSQIKNVIVRTGINNIGDGLFSGCTNLEEIQLPDTVLDIGANAFRNCESLKKIEMPKEMEIIGEGTFYNCKSLTTVSVPANVKVIAADAFNSCENLETLIVLGDLQEIGDRAFKNCISLIQLEIPKTLISIGEEAFFNCKEMQAIEIPKTVEFIGRDAFDDCGKLKVINFKNRKDITSLGRDWFPNGGDYREYVNRDTYVVQRESFEIVVGITEHGRIAPGTLNVKRSSTQEFIIEPEVGYKIKELIVDGEPVTPTLVYEFKPVLSTHTITATFEPIIYEITYDLADGILAIENPIYYTVEDCIVLNNPTKHGYTFAGWEGTELSEATQTVKIERETEDRHYTAKWVPMNYTIVYTNVIGATNTNPSTYTITDEIILVSATKPGYTFEGWYEDGNQVTTIAMGSSGGKILTAKWTVIPYTITYNGLDLIDNPTFVDTLPSTYNIESSSITLLEPVRTGYNFIGWTGTDLPNLSFNVIIPTGRMGDRSYTANWEAAWYTIEYDLAGGINSADNPNGYTIVTPSIDLKQPAKTGYDFVGWMEEGDVTGTVKPNVTIPIGSTGNKKFRAVWRQAVVGYNVVFNGANCTSNGTNVVVAGGVYSATVTPTNGYEIYNITVNMGGTDITSTASTKGNNGEYNVNIAGVTDDVEIEVKATDNQIILSINSDGTDYRGTNGEDGFKRGFRIANGKEHADEGWAITGFIPVSVGDTLRIKNVDITYQGVPDFGVYNYSFALQQGTSLYSLFGTKGTYSNEVYTYKISSYDLNAFNSTQCEYIRFCSKQLDENSIITINKEIN